MNKILTPIEYFAAKKMGDEDRKKFFSCTGVLPENSKGSKVMSDFREHFPIKRVLWLFSKPWYDHVGEFTVEAITAYYCGFLLEDE